MIVIDDIGLLPVATDTAEALYRVVDAAYQKRSVAQSPNLNPAGQFRWPPPGRSTVRRRALPADR